MQNDDPDIGHQCTSSLVLFHRYLYLSCVNMITQKDGLYPELMGIAKVT